MPTTHITLHCHPDDAADLRAYAHYIAHVRALAAIHQRAAAIWAADNGVRPAAGNHVAVGSNHIAPQHD